jgi:peptide deformylase
MVSLKMNSKLANNVLKNKSKLIETLEEAEIVVSHLENALMKRRPHIAVSAPEVEISKQVAIIRTSTYSLNLVNPRIVERKNQILSLKEYCFSFDGQFCNCLRYNEITVENGLDKHKVKLIGYPAFVVQHLIDHMNGSVFTEKAIKLALARKDGSVRDKDFCPCASKKRFIECCKKI